MARVLVSLVLLLSVAGHSRNRIFRQEAALYCLCKDGVARSSLEAAFDLACATGADCLAIVPNETCYDLKSLKSSCDYAVNSYFQTTGGCDFNGVAAITTHNSPKMPPACVHQSSPGPVAGRGRYYSGTRALPPNYFWPGIVPLPETGAAATLSGNWSNIDEVLFWLTGGCLMLVMVTELLERLAIWILLLSLCF